MMHIVRLMTMCVNFSTVFFSILCSIRQEIEYTYHAKTYFFDLFFSLIGCI
jgi:hypothetical protein